MTNTIDATEPARVGPLVQTLRGLYVLLAALFTGGIVLQVFFAGAGVLVSPQYFALHTNVGHMIELLPMLLLIVGLVARLPWRLVGLSALGVVLFMMQYFFLYGIGPITGVAGLRALHAVNALALFWLALSLTQQSWALFRARSRISRPQLAQPAA